MEYCPRSRPTSDATPPTTAKIEPPAFGQPAVEPPQQHPAQTTVQLQADPAGRSQPDPAYPDWFSHDPGPRPVPLAYFQQAKQWAQAKEQAQERDRTPGTNPSVTPDTPSSTQAAVQRQPAPEGRSQPDPAYPDWFSHDPGPRPVPMAYFQQAKLKVGAPNDVYEQEADRVAAQVMRMAPPTAPNIQQQAGDEDTEDVQAKSLVETTTPIVQRQEELEDEEPIQAKCEACEQEEQVQRAADGTDQMQPDVESRLNASQSGGSPLPVEVRSSMEPRFGTDFSQVRSHTGSEAVQMNQELNAEAFTHQQDVYFGAGKAPAKDTLSTDDVAHVVQQTGDIETRVASRKATVQLKFLDCGDLSSEIQRLSDPQSNTPANANYTNTNGTESHEGIGTNEGSQNISETDTEDLGKEALKILGYNEIIRIAVEAHFLTYGKGNQESTTQESTTNVKLSPDVVQNTIYRQVAEATEVFLARFTPYAVSAGIASQVDSPAPGPGDIVAIGILVRGLAVAGVAGITVLMASRQARKKERTEKKTVTESPSPSPPPPDICNKAIKVLEQYERLAKKLGKQIPPKRLAELDLKRNAGTITSNDLPGFLEFPGGVLQGMTLEAIRKLCGK